MSERDALTNIYEKAGAVLWPLTGHVLVTVIFNGCAQAYVLTSPDEAVFGTARINHRGYNLEKTFKRKNQKYHKKFRKRPDVAR